MEVIGQETDTTQAIAHIEDLKPDVIIWANTDMKPDASADETRLMEATPFIKTVSLSLQNNIIITHHLGLKTMRVAHDTHDLIEAINHSLSPSLPEKKEIVRPIPPTHPFAR